MDDPAFKSILDGFEAARTSLDHWLEFWSWLVVVGVACELVFIIWDHLEEKGNWHKAITHGMVPFPSRPSRIKLTFEILSVVLVVAGIVGELCIEAILGRLETDIRDTNERRVLQLQKEAGNAKNSAHDAAVDAGIAKSDAGGAKTLALGARTEADSFETKIASASKTAMDAESHLAEALREASAAQAELNRLKMPRSLPNAASIASALEKFKGTRYSFSSVFNDDDSITLLREIDAVLQSVGWVRVETSDTLIVHIYPEWGAPPGTARGVLVSVDCGAADCSEFKQFAISHPQDEWPPLMDAAFSLKNVLTLSIVPHPTNDIGKNLSLTKGNSDIVRIDVGQKP